MTLDEFFLLEELEKVYGPPQERNGDYSFTWVVGNPTSYPCGKITVYDGWMSYWRAINDSGGTKGGGAVTLGQFAQAYKQIHIARRLMTLEEFNLLEMLGPPFFSTQVNGFRYCLWQFHWRTASECRASLTAIKYYSHTPHLFCSYVYEGSFSETNCSFSELKNTLERAGNPRPMRIMEQHET